MASAGAMSVDGFVTSQCSDCPFGFMGDPPDFEPLASTVPDFSVPVRAVSGTQVTFDLPPDIPATGTINLRLRTTEPVSCGPAKTITGDCFSYTMPAPGTSTVSFCAIGESTACVIPAYGDLVPFQFGFNVRRGRVVTDVRIVLGAVAPIPWRVLAAEAALVARSLDGFSIAAAANASVDGAKPLSHNGYKVDLVKVLVRRTLEGLA